MRSSIRYLSLGLAIGAAGAALVFGVIFLLAGANAFSGTPGHTRSLGTSSPDTATPPMATATLAPLSSPTMIVLTTPTPFFTLTPDPFLVAINTGKLVFSGPLSYDKQVRLYAASLNYVQATVQGSIRESKAINGVGYGDPSNICGPLAIAIMRDAGVIPADTDPHEFWLLDPRAVTDQRKLDQVFPSTQFEHSRISTPINKIDWGENPLEPGDFLFIWHGSGGNFDHMLVVSRVDRNQRAYAVTNYGTPDGFLITETMLYDPNDPAQGIFHTWTETPLAILGSTGFGGYELWRQRSP